MLEIIITISLLVISAISKAIQDKLQFHYHKSIFSKIKNQNWWNPELSWKNKWEWFPNSKILTWLIANPLVEIGGLAAPSEQDQKGKIKTWLLVI